MTSCSGSLAKFLLGFINFAFILTAIYFIVVGYRLRLVKQDSENVELMSTSLSWTTVSTWIMVIGVVLAIISAFGFAATINESICMLNMYSYFLVLCSLLVLVCYVVAICFTNVLVRQARDYFGELVANYSQNDNARHLVDKLQLSLFCCGNLKKNEWHNVTVSNQTGYRTNVSSIPKSFYPSSCCGMPSTNMSLSLCEGDQLVYFDGCFSPVQISRVKQYAHSFFNILILSILLLLAISCCLERESQFRSSKRINRQYATHLDTCLASMPEPHTFGNNRVIYPN